MSQVAAAGSASTSAHDQQPVNEESRSRPTGPSLVLTADSDSQPLDPKFLTPSGKEVDRLASSSLGVGHITGFGGSTESSKSKNNSQQESAIPPTQQNSGSVPQG